MQLDDTKERETGQEHPAAGGSEAADLKSRISRWLETQCSMISGARAAAVVAPSAEGRFSMLSNWPAGTLPKKVSPGQLGQASTSGELMHFELEHAPGLTRLIQPVLTPRGMVVIVDVETLEEEQLRVIGNLLAWGTEWLAYTVQQPAGSEQMVLGEVFPLVAICLDQADFQALATTLVTELAQRFNCQRVSLGIRHRRQTKVAVLSHSARIKHDANLLRAISLAMDEAVDQDRVIVYTGETTDARGLDFAHGALAKETGDGCIVSLPFSHHGSAVGALTLERASGDAFDQRSVGMLERVLAVLAPVMLLMKQDEMSLLARGVKSVQRGARALLGPAHYRLKLAVIGFIAVSLFLALATGEWRVTAPAVIEGSVQRTIAAPIDGFIKSAEARAGDIVETGQVLGALDDSDLKLERLKWSTLRQQMVSESRDAAARRDRAEVSIISARIDQADAELRLLDEQLSRTRIVAPFDGVVIEGDLSQRLGTPVSRGDTLFIVAPLDDFRVILKVSERDIAAIKGGEPGSLVLASMTDRKFPLRVERITSVSSAEDGSNYFRVEASLPETGDELRPGMEGVGKIELGEANLAWVWSRDLLAWLRIKTWTWWR